MCTSVRLLPSFITVYDLLTLEEESAVPFLHSAQMGLAEAKFAETRSRTNMKATWLLAREDFCKETKLGQAKI